MMRANGTFQNYNTALWYALHVRPRCEKKMAEYCVSTNLEHYLPLRTMHKVFQRRRMEVLKPLFPGYVFASFSPHQRILMLKSQMIVRILEVHDQALLLDELNQIRKALEVNPGLGACPAVERGSRVHIVSGPFQGVEGIVATLKGKTRVILNVDIIGQGVSVEVSLDMLKML